MKKAITITIGFLHDFSAGCWAAALLATWRLNCVQLAPDGQDAVDRLMREFFYIGLVCMHLVIVAGAGRTFTYISNVYGPDAEKARRRLLMIKHVILAVVFGLGTYWQYRMVFGS